MKKYHLPGDLKVFGITVETFPDGIGEAFGKLEKMLAQGHDRSYYGITQCIDGKMNYMAAAHETYDGEGEKYGFRYFTIEKGDYMSESLTDWISKTEQIKGVIEQIIKDERVDRTKPAIEVYKNMKEMVCMVKIDARKEMKIELEKAIEEVEQLIKSLNEGQLNTIPFEGSWTAGQVADHLIKVNGGFAKLLYGRVKQTERSPDEFVGAIKKDFLDFNTKMNSPEFVLPKNSSYTKQDLLNSFEDIKAAMGEAIQTLDLSETCVAFEIQKYGYLTRTEALWFVISHTQRHVHQLKNILGKVK